MLHFQSQSDEKLDPYAILQVNPDASAQTIKARYRLLVRDCHPDLGTEPDRLQRFKQLVWAYRLLSHPVERAAYDLECGRTPAYPDAKTATAAPPLEARGSATKPAPRDASAAAATEEKNRQQQILTAGRDALSRGNWSEAEELGKLCLKHSRTNADAYVLIGEAIARMQRIAEASGCFRLALQLTPGHEPARRALKDLNARLQAEVTAAAAASGATQPAA